MTIKNSFIIYLIFVAFFALVAREKEISRKARNARKEGITIKNSFIIYLIFVAFFALVARGVFSRSPQKIKPQINADYFTDNTDKTDRKK